jgi:hypothetical protein
VLIFPAVFGWDDAMASIVRRPLLSLSFGAMTLLMLNNALARDDSVARANRIAYDAAIKCAVANSLAGDDRHDAGDEAGATAYKSKSRRSFDLTYTLGEKLGYEQKQIAHDLDFAQLSEMPKMVRDRGYFLSSAATCKALHLM